MPSLPTSMDNFLLCYCILRLEQTQFNAIIDAAIVKEITLSSANDMNYDIATHRNAYLYRCGAVDLSLISNALENFILDCNEIASLISKWNSSSNLAFCSLSKGPALDYLSFLIAFRSYVSEPCLFKTTHIITKNGAWRNTVKSMMDIVATSMSENFKGISLGNIHVVQEDPMNKLTKKSVSKIAKSDVLFMVKSMKDDLDEHFNSKLMAFFTILKAGALFFCIETESITEKIVNILSRLSGEMLYGPTEVSAQLACDCQSYKTEFGCEPIQSAKGMFFVWERKHDAVSACEWKEKTSDPLLSFENLIKNVGQKQIQGKTEIEIQNKNPVFEEFPVGNPFMYPLLHFCSEIKLSGSDSSFKRHSQLAESSVVEALPTFPVSVQAKILETESVVEKATKSTEASMGESLTMYDLNTSSTCMTSQSDSKTNDGKKKRRGKRIKKQDCVEMKGTPTSCLQISEHLPDSGDSLKKVLEAQILETESVEEKATKSTEASMGESLTVYDLNASSTCMTSQSDIKTINCKERRRLRRKEKQDCVEVKGTPTSCLQISEHLPVSGDSLVPSPELVLQGKPVQKIPVEKQPVETAVDIQKVSSTLIINETCFSQKKSSTFVSCKTNSKADDLSDSSSFSKKSDAAVNSSSDLNHPSTINDKPTCDNQVNAIHNGLKSVFKNVKERIEEDDCQTHQIMADKISDLTHQVNQITQSMKKALKASSLKSNPYGNSCEKKLYPNYYCNACGHASGQVFNNCEAYRSAYQGMCPRNSCCLHACSLHSCLQNKGYSCPNAHVDCRKHITINSCCLPERSIHSHIKSKCCNSCPKANFCRQEHTNIDSCSKDNSEDKINSDLIQLLKSVIPMNSLPEEALISGLKPICSKLKKD